MAPVLDKSSPLVTAEVTIAGVRVVALIDTGATSSCCRWGWYNQWKNHLGPLKQTNTLVVGVGNVPVELKGITGSLELEWDSVIDHCEMMVLTTLEDVDVILGMDIINRLDVQISGRSKDAFPRPESTSYAGASFGGCWGGQLLPSSLKLPPPPKPQLAPHIPQAPRGNSSWFFLLFLPKFKCVITLTSDLVHCIFFFL